MEDLQMWGRGLGQQHEWEACPRPVQGGPMMSPAPCIAKHGGQGKQNPDRNVRIELPK